ncbi:MAG: type II toxin-antitoxin system HicB family antitoxin [Armatimonadetes bacterium]|nr:type II toxin-antitoxin system HicB family antitoxin [Armatimonadota bacterium]
MALLHLTVKATSDSAWYVAECVEMGAVSQGEAIEEALANLQEATELLVEMMIEDGEGDRLEPLQQKGFFTTYDTPVEMARD